MESTIRLSQLLLGLIFLTTIPAFAQEPEAEDPFADYSYLWEDPKAKQKEEKRKQKEAAKKQKELDKLRKQGLLPDTTVTSDTTKTDILTDSTQATGTVVSDTIPKVVGVDSLANQPADSLEQTSPDPLTEPETPEESLDESTQELNDAIFDRAEEEEKKRADKEKRAKEDAPPIKDFRSGMGTETSGGTFNGGFTYTQIDGQHYVGMILSPEFSIWKIGLGLNVPILYGLNDQSIRTEIFEDGVGAARLIRYIRYGVQKVDPVYVKVGVLSNTMIGFGGLINNYSNTTSYEKRKLGIHYDLNYKRVVGIEGMYSDFDPSSANLLALRPYVRPLARTGLPVINTFEIGATYIQDKDQTNIPLSDSTSFNYNFTQEGVSAFGIDAGLTVLSVSFIQIDFFTTWSKLNMESQALTDSLDNLFTMLGEPSELSDGYSDGSGFSAGFNFRMNFIADVFSTDVRIERLSYSEHYLPQFFDANYEIQKDAKILSLGGAKKMGGIYGSLTGQVLNKVRLGGSLLIPDEVSESSPAVVRLSADLERLADKISLHGSYIKGDLADLSDAFKLDERSLAKLRFVWHMNKFLAAGVDYYWAFVQVEDGSYQASSYVMPYFGVSIDF